MILLTHRDLPDVIKEVPNEDSAAVLRESGWKDYEPPEVEEHPGIVPGTGEPGVEPSDESPTDTGPPRRTRGKPKDETPAE